MSGTETLKENIGKIELNSDAMIEILRKGGEGTSSTDEITTEKFVKTDTGDVFFYDGSVFKRVNNFDAYKKSQNKDSDCKTVPGYEDPIDVSSSEEAYADLFDSEKSNSFASLKATDTCVNTNASRSKSKVNQLLDEMNDLNETMNNTLDNLNLKGEDKTEYNEKDSSETKSISSDKYINLKNDYEKKNKYRESIQTSDARMSMFSIFQRFLTIRVILISIIALFLLGIVVTLFKKAGITIRKGLDASGMIGLASAAGISSIGGQPAMASTQSPSIVEEQSENESSDEMEQQGPTEVQDISDTDNDNPILGDASDDDI